jgi:hypothetical protein
MITAMQGFEQVIYIQGVGRRPRVQEHLPELWLPHGLQVEHQPIDWAATDYHQRIAEIGGRIIELSEAGNVSIVAASGGVKAQMSLLARYAEYVHRAVAINGKFEPFVFDSPTAHIRRPNLVESSGVMKADIAAAGTERIQKIFHQLLWIKSLSDETIENDKKPPELREITFPTHGHEVGIRFALTMGAPIIARFLRDGTVPSLYNQNHTV